MVSTQRMTPLAGHKCTGFTYLGVLLAVALIGIGLTAASEVWVTTANLQKSKELDWIGSQFTLAIGSYYQSTPGLVKAYPASLQELLEDRRQLTIRRHLRKIYLNPFTAKPDWELVTTSEGRVRGVRCVKPGDAGGRAVEYIYVPNAGM